ncbi:MAG: ABC transporter permease [Firmicutes bacterium]|nr:ABC transporter permease [Bacillota bacterium]
MASKFWYLTGISLKKKMKTKWFFVANLLILIVVVGIINIDSIISFFGGDFDEKTEIVILDNTNYTTDIFKNNFNNTQMLLEKNYEATIEVSDKIEIEFQDDLKESGKIGLIFNNNEENYLNVKIISNEKIDSLFYQILVQALTTTKTEIAMSLTNIDLEELQKITSPIEIERILLDTESSNEDENMAMIMGTVFPTIILPFFMLVVFLVQMIGTEINEEKSTRSMEIIISNVSPKTHFFSKILAANIFVVSQGLLLIIYAGFGLLLKNILSPEVVSGTIMSEVNSIWQILTDSGFVDKLTYIIPLTLILMILSFVAYSLVSGILASMTVNMEDFQQIQTPIMMISLLGYYLAIMAGMFEGSIFIRVLSYVPFLSCLLSPALLVIGQIGIIDVLISIIILIIFNYFTVKYGLKVYRIGILNYSSDKMWSRLLKAAKSKEI